MELVSIITPSYNSQDYIKEMINSIINQTYSNWELIITDDCSQDDTLNIINSFVKEDHRIKLFKLNKNSGPAIARNHSIKMASGKYIAFCDSDDIWISTKLEIQINYMELNNLNFTYSSYDIISADGTYLFTKKVSKKISYFSTLLFNEIGCLTVVYDKNYLGKMYMPNFLKRQDWGLWLIIMRKVRMTSGITQPLAKYRRSGGSISSNKLSLIKYNFLIYYKSEKYSFIFSLLLLIIFIALYSLGKLYNFRNIFFRG
tara:strand:+ start:670 stop:1443 length:774 start_codon:yes stop_codon:yes gene_type:complete